MSDCKRCNLSAVEYRNLCVKIEQLKEDVDANNICREIFDFLKAQNKILIEALEFYDGESVNSLDWEYCGPSCDTKDRGELARLTLAKIKEME